MVWALMVCALLLFPSTALGAPSVPYDSISTSSSYLDYFAAYLPSIPFGDDYVCYKSGQYEYRLVYGEISVDGSLMSSVDATVVAVSTLNSSGNHVSVRRFSSPLSLDVRDYLVYSSLVGFPSLRPDYFYLTCVIFCLVVSLVMHLLRSIWSFLLRMGVRVHDS